MQSLEASLQLFGPSLIRHGGTAIRIGKLVVGRLMHAAKVSDSQDKGHRSFTNHLRMKAKSLTLTTLNFSALHRLRQRGAPDSAAPSRLRRSANGHCYLTDPPVVLVVAGR